MSEDPSTHEVEHGANVAPDKGGFRFPPLAALWPAGLSVVFLITWFAPYTFGERTVHKLTFLMLVEFLVVHSTGFFSAMTAVRGMGTGDSEPFRVRAWGLGGLMAFYGLFCLGFSFAYGGPWPFIAFFAVALPKMPQILFRSVDSGAFGHLMLGWAAMTVLYLVGVFATTILPMPAFGISGDVIARQDFSVEGIWPEEPYRVIAFGAFYFAGLACYEGWLAPKLFRQDASPAN